jgi:ribosomal protein S18 acetylase RimI-like enzyme
VALFLGKPLGEGIPLEVRILPVSVARVIVAEPKLFADYAPREPGTPRGLPPAGMSMRPAETKDLEALARLTAEREGYAYAEAYDRRAKELQSLPAADKVLLVATLEAEVIGFGRAKYTQSVQFAPEEPTGPVPDGWYLTGLIIGPTWRRRGIGAALTRQRLNCIAQRAKEAYYFANSLNLASIELHRQLGFEPLQLDFRFPGCHFSGGGTGILFRCQLS